MEHLIPKCNHLKLGQCFCQAWLTYKKNSCRIIFATTIVFLCGYALKLLGYLPYGGWCRFILIILLTPPLISGYTFFCLRLSRNLPASTKHFLSGFRKFAQVFFTSLLLYLLFAQLWIPKIPFLLKLLVLLPLGIIFALRYSQSVIIVLDRSLSPIKAFALSSIITNNQKKKLFILYSILFLFTAMEILVFATFGTSLQKHVVFYVTLVIVFSLVYITLVMPLWTITRAIFYDSLISKYDTLYESNDTLEDGQNK